MSNLPSNLGARDEQGVDPTLIDEMLRLSPEERLRLNDQTINAIQELRDAFATKQSDGPDHEAGRGGG